MHLYLKNKFLYIKDYKIKCSIGKRGLTKKKAEGDLKTPKGIFNFNLVLYRHDKIGNIRTKIRKLRIKIDIIFTKDIWETKANNVGLKEVQTEYATIVQDDMLIKQKNWDKKLLMNFNK